MTLCWTGHIGVAQVAELARVRANPRCGDELGEVIDQLVDYAEQLDYPAFCKVVKRGRTWPTRTAHTTTPRSPTSGGRRRSIRSTTGVDLRASGGDAISTGWLMKIFDQFVEDEFRADVEARDEQYGQNAATSLLPRTDAQRRFDALVTIFRDGRGDAGRRDAARAWC